MTQFTSNMVLEEICRLLPEMKPDWKVICAREHRLLTRGFFAEQVVGRMAELHIENVLDVLRDEGELPLTSPQYPWNVGNYEIRLDPQGRRCVFRHGSRDKYTDIDALRFGEGIPFVVETKISSIDDHRSNKQVLAHAKKMLDVFAPVYDVGYIAVLNPEKMKLSGHRATLRSLGAHIVSFGMRREVFSEQALDAARRYGLWAGPK